MSVALQMTFLAEDRLGPSADIQGRAFFDDPLFTFVFPDVDERRTALPWLMGVALRYGLGFGQVHTNAGEMLGHAVWLTPGRTEVDPEGLNQNGFSGAATVMSEGALSRFGEFMEQVAPVHSRLMPEPHWYLMVLGVDPPHQGKGVGGALLQPVLGQADASGLSCYLETATERNLAFYRKHGFEVAEEQRIGGGGPRVWMMVRRPR